MIHLRSAMQFTKPSEKLRNVFGSDSSPCITNFYTEALVLFAIALLYFDNSLLSKLEGILDQVDQDLLVAPFVTNQKHRF